MYIINCFGSGIRYWLCRIPKNEFVMMDEYRIKNQCNWVDIFFNLEILDKFGYNDWESIHLLQEGKGWLLKKGNWIEIKKERKKRKIYVDEFMGNGFVFDFFHKEFDKSKLLKEDGFIDIALIQIESGLIFKFEIMEEQLDMDKMKFQMNFSPLTEKLAMDWVSGITYNGLNLAEMKEDGLTRESKVILL